MAFSLRKFYKFSTLKKTFWINIVFHWRTMHMYFPKHPMRGDHIVKNNLDLIWSYYPMLLQNKYIIRIKCTNKSTSPLKMNIMISISTFKKSFLLKQFRHTGKYMKYKWLVTPCSLLLHYLFSNTEALEFNFHSQFAIRFSSF